MSSTKGDHTYNKYNVKKSSDIRKKLFPNLSTYHYESRSKYLYRNCNKCISLLDVGSGPLKNIRNWKKNNIKDVYAIEPSEEYYNLGLSKIKNLKDSNIDINIYWGTGDSNWSTGRAGLDEENKKNFKKDFKNKIFNCITFEFSIHYMVHNYKQLLKNIDKHSTKGTRLLIYALDGEYLYNFFKNNDKYTINKNNEKIFEIEKKYDSKETENSKNLEVSVYQKGVHGLDNSPIENLVIPSVLIDNLKTINFFIINKKKMPHINEKMSSKLLNYERKISFLYNAYVFEKQ